MTVARRSRGMAVVRSRGHGGGEEVAGALRWRGHGGIAVTGAYRSPHQKRGAIHTDANHPAPKPS